MELSNDLCNFKWATSSHLPEILSFLYENFDKEETMLTSLRDNNTLTAEDEKSMRMDHERLIRAIFAFSPCLIAVEKSLKKIIGVNLMIVSRNSKFDDKADGVSAAFANNPPTTKLMKQYFNYLSVISEKADLFDKFPNARVAVEFYAVAIDKNYRRRGLSKALMAAGISFAKDTVQDAGFIFGVYTSLYSKKAAETLGLKSVMDVDLLTYKDADGQPIFQDTPPHNIVSVMVLQLA
ncbi:arylalkylamine N-acetyltransferase 1 [Osmia lignaria lignaria]|uniref:arylalkylamine N-acetyltransferase 1 n=1 Tax=Osmia lignaria lignaria TaxID=1437193 RepID=UPI00402B4170